MPKVSASNNDSHHPWHNSWKRGDFTIITSDGEKFKVPSHSLISASSVFRDAPAGGEKRVEFTDKSIETAAVLHTFLQLVLYSSLGSDIHEVMARQVLPTKTLNHYVKVITFMKKYDCAPTMKTFCFQILFCLCREKLSPSQAFGLGAIAGNDELCIASLAHARSMKRFEVMVHDLTRGAWKLVDPRYLYALAVMKHCSYKDLPSGIPPNRKPEDLFGLLLGEWDKCKSGIEGVF